MPITPEQLAGSGSEDGHQKAFFCALVPLTHRYPCLKWAHAIPNGGARDGITAGVLKATGVKSGVWDIFLPYPCGTWHGLYIEMKKPSRRKEKNKGLSDSQMAFGLHVHSMGYKTVVCFTWEEALAATLQYLEKE